MPTTPLAVFGADRALTRHRIQLTRGRRTLLKAALAAGATGRLALPTHLVGRARRRGRQTIDADARVLQTVSGADGQGTRLGVHRAQGRRARATLAVTAVTARRAVVPTHLVGRARRRGRRIIDADARIRQTVGGADGQGTRLGVHRARGRRARATLAVTAVTARRAVVPTHLVGRTRRRGRRIIDADARVLQTVGGADGQGTRLGVHRAQGRRARATLAVTAVTARRAVVPTHLVGRARRRGRRIIDANARVRQTVGGANGQGTRGGVHRAHRRRALTALTAPADATRRAAVPTHLVGRARRARRRRARGRRRQDARAEAHATVLRAHGRRARGRVKLTRARRAPAVEGALATGPLPRRAVRGGATYGVGRARGGPPAPGGGGGSRGDGSVSGHRGGRDGGGGNGGGESEHRRRGAAGAAEGRPHLGQAGRAGEGGRGEDDAPRQRRRRSPRAARSRQEAGGSHGWWGEGGGVGVAPQRRRRRRQKEARGRRHARGQPQLKRTAVGSLRRRKETTQSTSSLSSGASSMAGPGAQREDQREDPSVPAPRLQRLISRTRGVHRVHSRADSLTRPRIWYTVKHSKSLTCF